ncbi:hypothetical protein [Dasineura jujubifolia toursvirus 2a]|nr:hypothetical protein [Dasineura jujubifolia toursvirus 2a]
MFINIMLLVFTTIMLYFGYTYKAIITFIFTLFMDVIYNRIYRFNIAKTKNINENTHKLNFLYKDEIEYTLIIKDIKEQKNVTIEKIIALDGYTNKSKELKAAMGPHYNFFGYVVTPNDLGCDTLLVWIGKTRYAFENNHPIVFNQQSMNRTLISEIDDEDSESDSESESNTN